MNFQITTALMATKVFHKGAGRVRTARLHHGDRLAVRGAPVGPAPIPRLRVLALARRVHRLAGLLATAPTYELFAVYLVPTGLAALTALTTANAMVQLSVSPAMRGRVMALYMAIFMGGTPLGAPMLGWIGDGWGARWTIAIGTITVGLSVVAVAVWIARRQNVAVTFQTQSRPRLRSALRLGRADRPRGGQVNFRTRHRAHRGRPHPLRRDRRRRERWWGRAPDRGACRMPILAVRGNRFEVTRRRMDRGFTSTGNTSNQPGQGQLTTASSRRQTTFPVAGLRTRTSPAGSPGRGVQVRQGQQLVDTE